MFKEVCERLVGLTHLVLYNLSLADYRGNHLRVYTYLVQLFDAFACSEVERTGLTDGTEGCQSV